MRVSRKEDLGFGGLDTQGSSKQVGEASSKGGASRVEGIRAAEGSPFVEKLFNQLVADIREDLDALMRHVDEAASDLIAKPNQATLDAYKFRISKLMGYVIDKSMEIEKVVGLKKTSKGEEKMLTRVNVVNGELEQLTRELLDQQKPMLDLVNRLDQIRGLLIDFYDWKPGEKI